jgi:hypothetical protein
LILGVAETEREERIGARERKRRRADGDCRRMASSPHFFLLTYPSCNPLHAFRIFHNPRNMMQMCGLLPKTLITT